MKKPILSKSLCGCTLRTGSLCIGYISAVISLANTVFLEIELGHYKFPINLFTIYDIVEFIASILLLVGIYKKNFSLMTSWIAIAICGLILVAADIFRDLIYGFLSFEKPEIIALIILAFIYVITIYSMFVVHSYRRQLANSMEEERPQNSV